MTLHVLGVPISVAVTALRRASHGSRMVVCCAPSCAARTRTSLSNGTRQGRIDVIDLVGAGAWGGRMDRVLRSVLRLLLLSVALAAPAAASQVDHVLPFVADDYPKALAEARAQRLPLFIEAWAPW